jgi:XTP/dITP diphosphohydrolase
LKLVLASNNAKKLAELRPLLAGLPLELISQSALGVAEAEEPHGTFVENALAKARHAALATGEAAIADDSGLCVDALGGAPGVASAVYAPAPSLGVLESRESFRILQDAANNRLLLQRMVGLSPRRARYLCVLVALRSATDPEPLIAFGRWEGHILEAAQGQGGFGYDPLMFIPALGCTVAAVSPETKQAHSHRALAMRQMRALMADLWRL